jgi:hypothetical protein
MVNLDRSYGDHGRQDEQKRRQDDRRLNTGTMASAMSPPKRATPMALPASRHVFSTPAAIPEWLRRSPACRHGRPIASSG